MQLEKSRSFGFTHGQDALTFFVVSRVDNLLRVFAQYVPEQKPVEWEGEFALAIDEYLEIAQWLKDMGAETPPLKLKSIPLLLEWHGFEKGEGYFRVKFEGGGKFSADFITFHQLSVSNTWMADKMQRILEEISS